MLSSLNAWEEYLRQYLPHIRLLGEISLTPANLLKLEDLIRCEVKVGGLSKATQRLEERWPISFAAYLTFKSAFNPEWDFWGNVALAMGVANTATFYMEKHHWGKTYLRILPTFHLKTFEKVEASNQYITRIRLHGGIPGHSLDDFFAHILLPSLQKHDLQVLEDRPALAQLLQNGTVQQFVDTPVQLFFRHGGDSAQHFFSKCRDMARLSLNGETLPPAEIMGLRPYLVEAFRRYLGRQAEQSPVSKTRRRWKAPQIYFQPHQPPGYTLLLPEQVIPLEAVNRQPYSWRLIGPDGDEQKYDVRLYQPTHDVLTRASEATVEQPWAAMKVVFSAGGENVPSDLRREWPFTLLPGGQTPLLAFRYPDGKPLNATVALPADTCWLLYPAGAALRFGGTAPCVEAEQDYWPPWDAWLAAAYDLSQASWVQVVPADGTPYAPLPVETRLDEPLLLGGEQLSTSLPVEEKPLYIGIPPVLGLPFQPGQTIEQALKTWDVSLEARHDADPGGGWTREELAGGAHIDPQNPAILRLPLQAVLGQHPTGTYHLVCRAPDERTYELPFRICPHFEISGLQPYYLPDPKLGAQPACFQVRLQPGQRLRPAEAISSGSNGDETRAQVTILPVDADIFQITVPGQQSQADCLLEYPLPKKQVRLPIRLAVPRLRWALRLRPADALDWQSRPLSRPLAEVLQSPASSLDVELPNHCQEEVLVALKLVDPDSGVDLPISDTQTLRRSQEHLRFDLKLFTDTLRGQLHLSFLEFRLEWLDPSFEQIQSLPLLRLTQALDVQDARLESQPQGRWMIHWHEPQPLRHRHLYLWNEWQPWVPPHDIAIPDASLPGEMRGWWTAPIPEECGLPPGSYRAIFTVVPPYELSCPAKEPPHGAIRLETLSSQERLAQIAVDLEKQPQRAFALHLERACVYHSADLAAEYNQEIQWCLAHWREAPPLYLLYLHDWLERRDPISQRAVRMYMYNPISLQNLSAQPPAVRQIYMAAFPQAPTVSVEAASLALELSHEPSIILHALEAMLKSGAKHTEALNYILDEMEANRFADQDAVDLLRPYARQAIAALTAHQELNTPHRNLLTHLLQGEPQPGLVVLPGYWLRSDAGWGRIEAIRSAPQGEEKAFHLPGRDLSFLEVTLRPTQDPERVAIDLQANQLRFCEAEQTIMCSKNDCEHFISVRRENVMKAHNHAAHMGMGPAIRPMPNTFTLRHALEFRAVPPRDEFE